jgi:Formate hydrogenlyase subunit 6/NADH:ubiquinone oxidoreductase 23 kD subunit (chain I)
VIGNPFSKPATEKYPKEKLHLNDNYRGKPIFDYDACIGCGLCSRECPAKAIEMVPVGDRKAPNSILQAAYFAITALRFAQKSASTTQPTSSWRQLTNPAWS